MATKTKKASPPKKATPAKKSAPAKKSKPAKKTAEKKVKKPSKETVKKKTNKTVSKKTVKKTTVKPSAKNKTAKKAPSKAKPKKTTEKAVTPIQSSNSEIAGKNFLFTGTLALMSRKEAEQDVKDHGGKVLIGVSDKLDYLVVGQKAGSKLKEAKKHKNVQIIDEADFLMMFSDEGNDEGDQETNTESKYKVKFNVYGYGAENCVTSLSDDQKAYWKKKYKEDEYEAGEELKDHLWNYDYDEEIPATHFGKWYDQDSIVHAERAYYTEGAKLCLTVMKGDEEVEEIELDVTDKKLRKEYFEEFVPTKKNNKGEAVLYARSSDRGMYCYGEFEVPNGEKFDLSKMGLRVGKLFNDQFVWDVMYDGEYLEDEGCYDSTGKGFYADIYFY